MPMAPLMRATSQKRGFTAFLSCARRDENFAFQDCWTFEEYPFRNRCNARRKPRRVESSMVELNSFAFTSLSKSTDLNLHGIRRFGAAAAPLCHSTSTLTRVSQLARQSATSAIDLARKLQQGCPRAFFLRQLCPITFHTPLK